MFPIGRQISSHFQESETLACITIAMEDKNHDHDYPHAPPHFLQLLLLITVSCDM